MTDAASLRAKAESPFIRNQYGLWCPNCQEQIDECWPVSCDHCGYPEPDYERFDAYDEPDDLPWLAPVGRRAERQDRPRAGLDPKDEHAVGEAEAPITDRLEGTRP